MTPERFRHIEELYHAAREATADERAALLARADPELRHEVELLLAERKGVEFLDRPAIQHAFDLLEDSAAVPLAAGARLGPYRIEHKLGEGGMGEVFHAVDTRLGRAVAIKITHEQFSARFQREARAIASLNHPNICTVHDVGPNYLVMELVEGETLAARLKSGPLPMNTALLYASQIAAALAEAHAKDIVHRDLKPGNIMVARSGIKVLDFGLARSGQDQTVTVSRTVMGTPGYMAPEQREGTPADARADIYSFGCVLYEVFTGATVAARRRRFPSRKLEKIASRCLEEDPGRRWQSVAELQRELAGVTATSTHGTRVVCRRRSDAGVVRRGVFLFPARSETHRQGPHRPCRLHESDGRPSVRRNTATRTGRAVGAVAVPQSPVRPTHPKNAAFDERAGGRAIDSGDRAGGMRPDSERGRARRIDRHARKSVRPRPAREELHDRRRSRRRAGAGGKERRCPRRAGSDGETVQDTSG